MTRELGDRVFENNIYNLACTAILKTKINFHIYPLVKFSEKSTQKERSLFIRNVLYFT